MTVQSSALREVVRRELRYRLALRTIVRLEHHDDEPDLSHHWQEEMTDPFCPGCIAQKALDSHTSPSDQGVHPKASDDGGSVDA